jgi:signal peptidase I
VDELEVGDIIVFSSGKPYPIIHRIVATQMENGDVSYVTKGDNNPQPIVSFDLNEENVQEEQLLGKAVFRIPFVGYLKLLVVDGLALFGV